MSQLRVLMGLQELKPRATTAQAVEFAQTFRERMAGMNRQLRVVAAQASPAEHRPLETQRQRLYEAFQKASALIDPADPAKAERAIERVMAAVTTVEEKVTAVAEDATAGQDEWRRREAEFDDVMRQIGELEEAGNSKATALRKLGDAIRGRANDRRFQESATALGQLRPKLERIYAEHQQQTEGDADASQAEEEAGDEAPREGLTILVKDAENGDAIEGAAVQIGDQSDTTSAIGLATVELPVGPHDYEVSAEGFETVGDTVEVVEGDNPELVIEMAAGTGAREGLTVMVRDQESGDAIEGVNVTVGDQSDITSPNGLATFELPVGTYSFEASAESYELASGDVDVIEGDNAELIIELTLSEVPDDGGEDTPSDTGDVPYCVTGTTANETGSATVAGQASDSSPISALTPERRQEILADLSKMEKDIDRVIAALERQSQAAE